MTEQGFGGTFGLWSKKTPKGKSINPRLTAVVLCYNKAQEIKRFATSLLRQTRFPDQLLVVDDCSTDAPASYYRGIFGSWPVIRLSRNQGQSHARNIGAAHAKGEFIIFLDGDIEMKPDMLQKMEAAMLANPGVSIIYSHYDRVGTRTDHVRARVWDKTRLREQNYITMMSLVRTADLPKPPFDEALRRYEDWDLWLRMAAEGKKGLLIPEVLFLAYYKQGDISGTSESAAWYTIVRRKHKLTV